MKKIQNTTKKIFGTVKKFFVGTGAALTMAMATSLPASAVTTINKDATTENVVGGILDVIFQISFWLGVVIAVIGLFMFLYSFKDDNADAQGRGAKMAIVGATLIGLKLLVSLTGLIS